ncbi:MAG: hypothetical protein LUE12_04240 [Ruminococcus sp.]|nr:hypothetical protein [Ruminococcus sp.]
MLQLPRYIAHRGLHSSTDAPENSFAAFQNAVDNGFAIELDVRFTADRRMVVFHDADTERMCGIKLEIAKTSYEELAALRIIGTDERIPLLTEVLKLVAGRVMLFIELKSCPEVVDAEKRLAHLMKRYNGDFAVQSFDPFSLKRLRAADENMILGQLVSTYSKGESSALRKLAANRSVWKRISKPDYLAWDLRSITLEAAFEANDIDAALISWTADGKELVEAAEPFSDAIIFENVPLEYFNIKR